MGPANPPRDLGFLSTLHRGSTGKERASGKAKVLQNLCTSSEHHLGTLATAELLAEGPTLTSICPASKEKF